MTVNGHQDCALDHARRELHAGNIRPVIHYLCAEAAAVQAKLNAGGPAAEEARAWLDHVTRELCTPPVGPVEGGRLLVAE